MTVLLPLEGLPARIGVLGDVHADPSILEAVLAFLACAGLQAILCAGDIADGWGSVDACCELLEDHQVIVVRGNHDRWLLAGELRDLPGATLPADISLQTHQYLRGLPVSREFDTPAGCLLLCHGIGSHDMRRITPDDYGYALASNFELQEIIASNRYRFMINGHTHRRMVRTFGTLTVINAGSLAHRCSPCFLTVDFEQGHVQFYDLKENRAVEKSDGYVLPKI